MTGIRIRGLAFSYGEKAVFSGLDMDIGCGVTVLGGASGSGKTTLLRLIAGLSRPAAGTIAGVPEKIAFMFQEDRLLPWLTAEGNVGAALPRGGDAGKWLGLVELGGLADRRPGALSGGQRRRVALARALAFGGALLILDEPLKGMDEALMSRLVPKITALDVPILVTSHSEFETGLWGGETVMLQ